MLEQLRQNSRSVVIWIMFGLIIASFVVTFGTQGEISFSGCGGATGSSVMTVDGEEVSVHSWRYVNAMVGGAGGSKTQRSRLVLDALLRREILAQAAVDAGFHVSDEMVTDMIRDGRYMALGTPRDGKAIFFSDGYFDYGGLERFVAAMNLPSVDKLIVEQKRELEAAMMQALIVRGAVASPEEARSRYVYDSTTATVDVLQLRVSDYQRKITLSPEQVDRYLQAHESEVRAKYDADAALYKGRGKEVKIGHIFVARKQGATLTPGAVDAGPADADPDPGLLAAREARERILAGADFAQVALDVSEEERSKNRGGSLGWRSQENPGLGARELADAVKALEVGAVSEVITTTRGFHIVKIEEAREGDLSFEQVAREIAEQMAVQHYAEAAARRDAQRALERARAALAEGKKLDEVFERKQAGGGFEGFENLPPEIQQQLLQQLEKQGSVMFDGPDRPAEASWQGGAPAAPGDQPAPAPAAAAAPAAGAAAEPEAPEVEDVPVPLDLVKPQVQQVGPFTRDVDGVILGVGKSEELMKAIFTELEVNQLTDRVYEMGESFAFVQLVSRQEPNLEEFQKDQLERTRFLGLERGFGGLQGWLQSRCEALNASGQIEITRDTMNQLAAEREGEDFTYEPNCAGLNLF